MVKRAEFMKLRSFGLGDGEYNAAFHIFGWYNNDNIAIAIG